MAKSYVIVVEFHMSFDGRSPVMQYLDCRSSGPEFGVLLTALNDSPMIADIRVYSSTTASKAGPGMGHRLTREDLGYENINVCPKLK